MFKNLHAEIARNSYTKKSIAEFLGISESSLRYKLSGKTEFTLSEIKKLKQLLGENLSVEYLFEAGDMS